MRIWMVVLLAALLVTGCDAPDKAPVPWRDLEPGLAMARFSSRTRGGDPAGDLTVLRVDPELWRLRVISTGTAGVGDSRNLDRWCEDFGLVAAINAGMYQQDGRTHVGYCQVDGQVLNAGVNRYQSALTLDPRRPGLPLLRIWDLDEVPLDSLRARFGTVVQNLRLIKRPREPRWSEGTTAWSEAALAEDGQGRALLLYCTRPLSMHAFNRLILDLPLDVVCAQHLEGNFPAQLWVRHPQGSVSSAPSDQARVLPVILGVKPR